jgi:hypothetical protein
VNLNWQTVRNLGRVKYFNISYVVLLGVPLAAEVYPHLHLAAPFSPYIKFLYGASLCFAMAIAIYQLGCPAIIKTYESDRDYVEAYLTISHRAHPDRQYEIVLAHLLENQESLRKELITLHRRAEDEQDPEARKALESALVPHYPSCLQRALFAEYAAANNAHRWAIWLSGLLYATGIIILVVLLVRRTMKVLHV